MTFVLSSGENWTNWYYYALQMWPNPFTTVIQLFYYSLANYVLLALFIEIIVHNFDAKAEERERQQRTAYDRLQELVRSECSAVPCLILYVFLTYFIIISQSVRMRRWLLSGE